MAIGQQHADQGAVPFDDLVFSDHDRCSRGHHDQENCKRAPSRVVVVCEEEVP